MLTSKCFVRKTKKGGILRTVREHYLRDDIMCGSAVCSECPSHITSLEEEPCSYSELCSDPHYIIPDTNVLIHQVCISKLLG